MSDHECIWTYDEHTDSWDTGCDNKHLFTDGGPKDNQYKFCPYCGVELVEARPEDEQ